MADFKRTRRSFEEGWPLLQTAVDRLINKLEEEEDETVCNAYSIFTTQEFISYYTTVFEICIQENKEYTNLLHLQYKKVFEEYIKSTVLPSLREKKDELLLRELLRRWSNHKIMTRCLSRLFSFLDRQYCAPRRGQGHPSLEETAFLSFYDLVYDEVHKQAVDALLAMIDRKHAGEQIDQTLVNNTLAVYSEISESTRKSNAKHFAETMIKENAPDYYDEASKWIARSSFLYNTPKEEKMHDSSTVSSKKINLVSSDGYVFEVDYNVALMSKTIEDAIETNPGGYTDSISLPVLNSKLLTKVIEYCEKHSGRNMSDVDLRRWDVRFLNVDRGTLFDFVLSANYMNIKSLLGLTLQAVAGKIRGRTQEEIRQFFANQ